MHGEFLVLYLETVTKSGVILIHVFPQGCMSVAFITPKTTEWVYEAPKKIMAEVVLGVNKTATETINIYDSELNWRGEIFLACGM